MQDVWVEENRPLKAHVRRLAAEACGKGKTRAIMFPAGGAHDVRVFLASGVLTKRTRLTAVEGVKDIAKRMWVSLFRLGLGPVTTRHIAPAHKLKVTEPVDLAFLDFCGPGRNEEIAWIRRILPQITGETSDVLITLKANNRGMGYFADLTHALETRSAAAFRAEQAKFAHVPTVKTKGDGQIVEEPSSPSAIRALTTIRMGLDTLFRSEGHTFEMRSTIYSDLDVSRGTTQGDRTMILVHLSKFKKQKNAMLRWH